MKKYLFGDFTLDTGKHIVCKEPGQFIELAGKPFAVLVYLIEHRNRLVSKEELLNQIWRGTEVTEASIYAAIHAIRNALKPYGGAAYVDISTGQGYRFTGEVQEQESGLEARPATAAPASRWPRRVFWSAVAVLVVAASLIATIKYIAYERSPQVQASRLISEAVKVYDEGNDAEAIEIAQKAVETDPSFVRAYLLAAWWETFNDVDDRTKEADEILSSLRTHNSRLSTTEDDLAKGIQAQNHWDLDEATKQYHQAFLLSPNNSDVLAMYGSALFNTGQYAESRKQVRTCLSIEPTQSSCFLVDLENSNALNDFQQTLRSFANAPPSLKRNPWILEEVGYAYLGQGQYQDGLQRFQEENAAGNVFGDISLGKHYRYGKIQAMLLAGGKNEDVISLLEDDIKNASGHSLQLADLHSVLGAVLTTLSKCSDAANHLEKALQISDEAPGDYPLIETYKVYQSMGICGDFKGAAAEVAEEEENGADSPEIKGTRVFIEAMQDLSTPGRSESAAAKLANAHDYDPDPLYDYYRAQALLESKQKLAAKEALKAFLDHRGEFLENNTGMATLLLKAEDEYRNLL